jgi:Trp operon repressor
MLAQAVEAEQDPVSYPRIDFWKSPGKKDRLVIINEGDIPKDEIFSSLGIKHSHLLDSFGICDIKEITSRQDILRYLIRNQDFSQWLINQRNKSPLPGSSQDSSGGENHFLAYFDPEREHTPFWRMIHQMLAFLNREDALPEKLRTFRDALQKTMSMEEIENQLGRDIGKMIRGVALIEGIIVFRVTIESSNRSYKVANLVFDEKTGEKSSIFGYSMYSQAYANAATADLDEIRASSLLNRIGLGSFAKELAFHQQQKEIKKALQEKTINEFSDGLVRDIREGLLDILRPLSWSDRDFANSEIGAYFSYSREGLQIRIFSWEIGEVGIKNEAFKFAKYDGYTSSKMAQIKATQDEYTKKAARTFAQIAFAGHLGNIERQRPGFFETVHSVRSFKTDDEHRWFALSNLYNTTFRPSYLELDAHRRFFFRKMKVLSEMADVALKLSKISEMLNCPLCWPEFVLDGSHIVAFEKIMPIHLIGKKGVKITPIQNMPVLNGQLLGFTGHHEGGKTVTTLTIAELIFLAQSGLPVFGEGVKLNPKKMLGAVFMTRGEGSTARTMLDKIVKVIEASRGQNPHEVVVIFDELGEGTQELSGDKLGCDVLTALKKLGVSVAFNTQITSLAEYAKQQLGAQCMQFTADHQISPGIGTGDMEGLRQRSGLDKALSGLN